MNHKEKHSDNSWEYNENILHIMSSYQFTLPNSIGNNRGLKGLKYNHDNDNEIE